MTADAPASPSTAPGIAGPRVLLFTGKGGVGKTTVAAATALACAERGARTLVVSTDPAHSLADVLDVALGDAPVEVAPGLWGQQLDAQQRMEAAWAEIRTWLVEVFQWAGLDAVEAEELAVLPGLDEVFALADIKEHADSGAWDVLVVDCAPTAETIRFLSLPDILAWYMDRVFPMGRQVNKVVAPVLSRVTTLPVAGDQVFGATQRFYDRLDGVKALLADPARSTVRLVVNPERIVVAETRRTATYLALFGYHVDAVIANRLLPDAVTDPFFEPWKAVQATQLAAIDEGFAPLPILRVALQATEPVGIDALRSVATDVYGENDPRDRLHEGAPLTVTRIGDRQVLELDLPFASLDDLEVGRHADELLVRVGPYRRAIALPAALRRRSVGEATLRGGRLRVSFDPP